MFILEKVKLDEAINFDVIVVADWLVLFRSIFNSKD
jgi:hypothetical protein